MKLNKEKDSIINSLLSRNLYLESIIFGTNSSEDNKIFETPLVFIVKESKSGNILGVFLDQISAEAFADKNELHAVCEPWSIQARPSDETPAIIVPCGVRVSVCQPHRMEGVIVSSDNDISQGIGKVLYKFLPDGLPNEEESFIVIYHYEIKEVLND